MSSDPEGEIRASVGAHADLGPGYEDAVAEGLVERIGAEIDKRIEARLAQTGAAAAPGPAPGVPTPAGVPAPGGAAGAGVAATAIVSSAGGLGGQGFIIVLIWVAIAIINVAYARHS